MTVNSSTTSVACDGQLDRPDPPQPVSGGLSIKSALRPSGGPGMPLITVVTVVKNGEAFLEETIISVLEQSYKNVEYIVIDGGSTDGTIDIIKKYEDRIDYWVSEPDTGIYDAMNKGIRKASGELINLLNADDYLEPDAVESIAEKYRDMDEHGILYGNAYYIDEAYSVKSEYYSFLRPWIGMTVNHQSMFVHRCIYDRIGLYDTAYKLCGDYDFFLRCVENRVNFNKIDRFLVNCRNRGANIIYSRISKREASVITRRHFGYISLKRVFFLVYNFIWVPVKFGTRTFLYETIGTKTTRNIINVYKRMRF
ncbi:MAG: glycosyltransferase [Deltaproteobacteria bacterium]|nr:glycosyltransferase [Deltaproteobacteria bacterium]